MKFEWRGFTILSQTALCLSLFACSPTGPESSPGGRLAFLGGGSDGNFEILTGRANGSGMTTVIGGLPEFVDLAWSPDATEIVYATNFGGTSKFDLYTVNVRGSVNQALSVDGRMPAWSPDGQRIAFSVTNDESGRFDLYTMTPNGGDIRPLVQSALDKFSVAWSPDGGRIAYESRGGSRDGIYVAWADGSDPTMILGSLNGAVGAPAWSPDGGRIVFESTMHRGDALDPLGQYEIYVMNADGSNVTRLTFLSHERRALRFPTWSSDDQSIAFESQTEIEGEVGFIYRILKMGVDGSDPKEIAFRRGVRSPKWSPF
jgi:Tol biopolymer transport system component